MSQRCTVLHNCPPPPKNEQTGSFQTNSCSCGVHGHGTCTKDILFCTSWLSACLKRFWRQNQMLRYIETCFERCFPSDQQTKTMSNFEYQEGWGGKPQLVDLCICFVPPGKAFWLTCIFAPVIVAHFHCERSLKLFLPFSDHYR